jgi:hypothetical protein
MGFHDHCFTNIICLSLCVIAPLRDIILFPAYFSRNSEKAQWLISTNCFANLPSLCVIAPLRDAICAFTLGGLAKDD